MVLKFVAGLVSNYLQMNDEFKLFGGISRTRVNNSMFIIKILVQTLLTFVGCVMLFIKTTRYTINLPNYNSSLLSCIKWVTGTPCLTITEVLYLANQDTVKVAFKSALVKYPGLHDILHEFNLAYWLG